MIEFEIIAHGLYRPEQLIITYDPLLRMPMIPTIKAWMDDVWTQKLAEAQAQNIPLFDAPLYRFIEASTYHDTLRLTVGDTGYKEYVTTRLPEFAETHTRQELGNALSVCSVVETSDGSILLDKRQGVDVYVGRYHVIGGFFERGIDTIATCPDPFGAMCREIREETGIRDDDIKAQYCLGVVYDLATPHAELCFLTELHISLEEALTRVPEDNEIQRLETLLMTEENLRAFILNNHGNISATGEPNLLLYGGVRFGQKWFEEMMGRI